MQLTIVYYLSLSLLFSNYHSMSFFGFFAGAPDSGLQENIYNNLKFKFTRHGKQDKLTKNLKTNMNDNIIKINQQDILINMEELYSLSLGNLSSENELF